MSVKKSSILLVPLLVLLVVVVVAVFGITAAANETQRAAQKERQALATSVNVQYERQNAQITEQRLSVEAVTAELQGQLVDGLERVRADAPGVLRLAPPPPPPRGVVRAPSSSYTCLSVPGEFSQKTLRPTSSPARLTGEGGCVGCAGGGPAAHGGAGSAGEPAVPVHGGGF